MTTASPTYRLSAALAALLFALGWGVSTVQAGCVSPGAMGGDRCGGTETEQHCDGEVGTSGVCLMHHASQDAFTDREARTEEEGPSVDPLTLGGGEPVRPSDSIRKRNTTSFLFTTGPAIRRAYRLRAHVGVWLE